MSILIGIALFGLWGDVAVGIVVLVVDILIGAPATLGTRRPRSTRPDLRGAGTTSGRVKENGTAVASTTR
jgi:hypothetical protein